MRKIFLYIVLLSFMIGGNTYAQTNPNRTAKTKVSDVLAQMPAKDPKQNKALMTDLVSTGSEGIEMLTSMFESTNNVPVSYALSGWANAVTGLKNEQIRKQFVDGITKAISSSSNVPVQTFYLTLLQETAGQESVAMLTNLLKNEALRDPALAVLAVIQTPDAKQALADADKAGYVKKSTYKPLLTPQKTKETPSNQRIAALVAMVSEKGAESSRAIIKAMDDADRSYRVKALELFVPYANDEFYKQLQAKLASSKNPEAKVDIVTFLGNNRVKSTLAAILPLIGNANSELSIAAMWAATRITGNGVPAALVEVLKNDKAPAADLKAAKSCLLSYKGNVNDVVTSAVERGSNAGKCAALEVLAARRATGSVEDVIKATKSDNKAVATAAYAALRSVVTESNLPKLYTMLETSDLSRAEAIQQAIVSALSGKSKEAQIEDIQAQMRGAGAKKNLYYVVLAGTGVPAAIDIIAEGFQTGNDADKQQALNALLAWNGVQVADQLLKIARSGDAKYADKALAGYVSKIAKSAQTPELKVIGFTEALALAKTPAQKVAILKEVEKCKVFQGLVLSSGYLDNSDKDVVQAAALAVMNIALANKQLHGEVITTALNKTSEVLTGGDADYQRESIRKHLAALPKEGGYVSVFNGKDLSGWKGLVKNPIARAKMSADELSQAQVVADQEMRTGWEVKDGKMIFTGKGNNICTQKQYGDFEMYVDWLLYPDTKEADAGVYLRGAPQVQMWDTSRRNVGAQVGSGGLYNNKVNQSTPTKVADNKLGEWNTFYIKMVADRVTVVLNGEKVVDNVILENYWDRKQPIFPIEQIELQAHGTRVAYRNIYINELPRQEPFTLPKDEADQGFKVLFDGTNMYNWEGNTKDYVVEDGTITLYPKNGGGGNLYTKEEYDNFVFRFEFMLTPGANNGLGIRTPTQGDAAYVGMELQILDNDAPIYSKLEKYQYHGSVYGVIPAKRGFLKPNGEWNYEEVAVNGNHIKVTLNGTVILDGDIAEASKNGTLDHKNHPGLLNKSGRIGFLGHGSIVKFKNIRIKPGTL